MPHPDYTQEVYEGDAPYLFISYSHKDTAIFDKVKIILNRHHLRYWYDEGLHSGDDWNLIIATHLHKAAACLVILSPNSVESEYVKNELNFALNHRIPVHTLITSIFDLPLDIEMMTGRIQRICLQGEYENELIQSLPPEIAHTNPSTPSADQFLHPLYHIESELYDRQGTKTYLGRHRSLNYQCIVQIDSVENSDERKALDLCILACRISHKSFPKMLDAATHDGFLYSYFEYHKKVFLDHYLENHSLSEDRIINWCLDIIDGVDFLYQQNLSLRDFARGSIMVVNDSHLEISRLHNVNYGLVPLTVQTRKYFFEEMVQEIGILLSQLCTGIPPVLPLRIISQKRFSPRFLEKINLVVQKCTKENGHLLYSTFDEIKQDLLTQKITQKNKLFLKNRTEKLARYDSARSQRKESFISNDSIGTLADLEKSFGFEGTVVFNAEQSLNEENEANIKIQICATGQIMEFHRKLIRIGKEKTYCDLVLTQPYVSRCHLIVIQESADSYKIIDQNSTNKTYVTVEGKERMLRPLVEEIVSRDAIIRIGEILLKLV